MTARDDAVQAAAEALCGPRCGWGGGPCDSHTTLAEAVVTAAAPILLAAERALVADLRALCDSRDGRSELQFPNTAGVVATGTIRALLDRHAARVAETAPDVPMSPIKGHAETTPEEGP